MPLWTWLVPGLSFVLLLIAGIATVGTALAVLCFVALLGTVIAAVHHAEVIAHRVGEPFGTLVLALAVTVIEASLILSMMIAGGKDMATLPRDTIYAATMIICNGVVGICLVVGGLAHREQTFRVEGSGAGMAALIAMATLTLAMPAFTTTTPGGTYSTSQLLFVAASSAALWAVFVFIQTVSHRDYFIPVSVAGNPDEHAEPPTTRTAWISFAVLVLALVTVVGLAKAISPSIERAVEAAGAPRTVVGIVIAMLVLLPESWAAARAAHADRLQSSMNLAIGSALACIGLTIPVVVLAALAYNLPLVLGLGANDLVLLAATFLVSAFTLGTGRTHMMQGAVHLVMFAAFVFLAFVP
jgi:Ca2+:H+ antiporter